MTGFPCQNRMVMNLFIPLWWVHGENGLKYKFVPQGWMRLRKMDWRLTSNIRELKGKEDLTRGCQRCERYWNHRKKRIMHFSIRYGQDYILMKYLYLPQKVICGNWLPERQFLILRLIFILMSELRVWEERSMERM